VPTLEKVIEDLNWLSDRISTQVRTMSIGLLAIAWGLLIGKPEISQPLPLWLKKNLLAIGILALVVMLSDFLQYFFGLLVVDSLRKSMEKMKQTEAEYDYGTITYRLRKLFFWVKLFLVVIACIWFLAVIIPFCIEAVLAPTS
jgi:hypothetical protein